MVEFFIALISCGTTLLAVLLQHKLITRKKKIQKREAAKVLQNTFIKNVYLVIKKEDKSDKWKYESNSSTEDKLLKIVEDKFEFVVEFESKEYMNLDNMKKIKEYTEALNKEVM